MKYLPIILLISIFLTSCSASNDKSVFHQNRTRAEVSRSEEMANKSADHSEEIKKELERIKEIQKELIKTQASISQKGEKCR